MAKIIVKDNEISIVAIRENDYVSITDIAKYKNAANADDVIKNWMRNRNTIELLGLWETIHNPDFKPVEFDGFRKDDFGNATKEKTRCKYLTYNGFLLKKS